MWQKTNFAGFELNLQSEMNNSALNISEDSSILATMLCTSEQIGKASFDLYSQNARLENVFALCK